MKKTIFEKTTEALLRNPEVVACLAAGIKYELKIEPRDLTKSPTKIVFKTIFPVKFIKNKEGVIIRVEELGESRGPDGQAASGSFGSSESN